MILQLKTGSGLALLQNLDVLVLILFSLFFLNWEVKKNVVSSLEEYCDSFSLV